MRQDLVFDPKLLEAEECFSSGDIEWIQERWEEFDESRRDLRDQVDSGEVPSGEEEWVELNNALLESIGETGYSAVLHATGRSNGIQFAHVLRKSRAADAGLVSGDQVLRYNGVRVHEPEVLAELVQGEFLEDLVEIEVRHHGGEIETVLIEPGPMGSQLYRWEVSPCVGKGGVDEVE